MQLFLIPTKKPALLMAQITWGRHSDTHSQELFGFNAFIYWIILVHSIPAN